MTDEARPDSLVQLVVPSTDQHWQHANTLIAELKEWDVAQSQPLGFTRDEVLATFYPDELPDIQRNSAPPEGRFLIAMEATTPAACAPSAN